MKLSDQVCNLELAKRLKELGVKQESLFYWSNCCIGYKYEDLACSYVYEKEKIGVEYKNDVPEDDFFGSDDDDIEVGDKKVYSAFTVAELGEMLPKIVEGIQKYLKYSEWYLRIEYGNCWRVGYISKNKKSDIFISDDTEANARAKMLIYLLEQELLKL